MKNVFFVMVWVLMLQILPAQQVFVGFGGGYNLALASQNLTSELEIGISETRKRVVRGSFGEGMHLSVFGGYELKPDLALELHVSYTRSKTYRGHYRKDTSFFMQRRFSADILRLAPVIRVQLKESLETFYLKAGPIFRVAGRVRYSAILNDYENNSLSKTSFDFSRGFSVGALAAIGRQWQINSSWRFFAECSVIAQSWAPARGDIKEYSINGVDMRQVLNISQNNIHYSNVVVQQNKNFSGWEPLTDTKQFHPFSSVGLSCGLTLLIQKKTK